MVWKGNFHNLLCVEKIIAKVHIYLTAQFYGKQLNMISRNTNPSNLPLFMNIGMDRHYKCSRYQLPWIVVYSVSLSNKFIINMWNQILINFIVFWCCRRFLLLRAMKFMYPKFIEFSLSQIDCEQELLVNVVFYCIPQTLYIYI